MTHPTPPTFDSLIKQNAIKDPNYCPLCMRCDGLKRMVKVEPLLWRCGECGVLHDERGPTPPTCPECGAAYQEGIAIQFFECGSSDPKEKLLHSQFWQSDRCRIASLTHQLAATRAERDAAISLLSQLNPNRGLFLNGVAIGWHHDSITGFAAGIGGSKTIYPSILAAIRAALAKG